MSNTATVATPAQPQTTVEPSGGPFIRHSEPGKARLYDLTGNAFGGLINNPLNAIPGYVSKFRIKIVASAGANTTSGVTTTQAADAPYNVVQLITLWDALGTPIYSLPGYEALRLIPMFSGGFGLDAVTDPSNLPSYSAVAVGASTAGTGNFSFASAIPLEFAKGYGVMGMADGDVLPKLQIQLAPATSVYTTSPTTLPSIEVRLNADYYWLPQGEAVAPVGLGSTRQWFLQQGNPTIGSAGTTTVTIPRQGGWIDTIIFELRDSTSARVDSWPLIIRFSLDGIGEISTNLDEIYDDMAITWGIGAVPSINPLVVANGVVAGVSSSFPARPIGVIAISRKTSLGQRIYGLLDTYEVALSTSPGTAMALEGAPWGTVANAPATLQAILGQVIPSGALVRGLEEV